MKSVVYWGSPRQARLDAKESLPAKLDLILEKLHLRDRVKDEVVALKMHLGNNLGYSVVHPVFVRKVVKAIKDGGGHVFVCDLDWDANSAAERGYTPEVLGCPVLSVGGLHERYHYAHDWKFKNIKTWKVAGMIEDASFLVNFAHAKGHPSNSYGGAMKNLALGHMIGETRSAIHDTCHFDPYWFAEKCPDDATRQRIIDSCPHAALVQDKKHPDQIHLHIEQCNQCMRCMQVAPEGSLKIQTENFYAFQEANAISVAISLGTFAKDKATHLVLATHMTPVCDCFGFTSMPILPDAGIFGSDDIVAVDQAVLDMTAKTPLIEENVPTSMEVHTRQGHPLSWLHGPMKDPYKVLEYAQSLGLGNREYDLVDVFPVEEFVRPEVTYIPAS